MKSGDPTSHSSVESRIFEEAAHWFSRSRAGLSEAESSALLEWLKVAPEHAAAMELVASAWTQSADAAGSAALRPELLRAKSVSLAKTTRQKSWRQKMWNPALVGGAAAIVICGALAAVAWVAASTDAVYKTARGETLSIALRDGSRVTLGSGTLIHVHIDPLRRESRLESGEAEFEIAHQARRPFRVSVRDLTVRDLGTRFTVRDRTGPVRVVLVSGAVEIVTPDHSNRPTVLAPGQQALVDHQGIQLTRANLSSVLAWREGRLVLRDVTLADALDQWRDVAPVDFDLEDPALAQLRISGVYHTTDIVAFLNGLSRIYPVAWQEKSASHFSLRKLEGSVQP
jgi:transmembrane sensor